MLHLTICAVTGTTNAHATARTSRVRLCMASSRTTKYRKSPKITKNTPTAVAHAVPLFTGVQGPFRYASAAIAIENTVAYVRGAFFLRCPHASTTAATTQGTNVTMTGLS